MSDEIFPTATRQIDIPARFIRQAIDHIQHTGSRYVSFLFTGEQVIDAICVGVTTRLLITDQRRPPPPPSPETVTVYTLDNLTDEVILAQVREHGPIAVKNIGSNLGIAGSDISLRQKIRRVLRVLTEEHKIRKINNKDSFPTYAISTGRVSQPPPRMPIRSGKRITRQDITEEKVFGLIQQNGRTSSRVIGDTLNIPRGDASVRGKISTLIQDLIKAGRVRITEGTAEGGGRVYEIVPEPQAEVSEA